MGTNVVRLVRIDHRRLEALLGRLGRHRPGSDLPDVVAGELFAHIEATSSQLLPFADERLDAPAANTQKTIQDLSSAAQRLEKQGDAHDEAQRYAMSALWEHISAEERELLESLDAGIAVERLRVAGDDFRRTRDAALKARGHRHLAGRRPAPSRAELYERARARGIPGRAAMTSGELLAALKEQS